MVFLDDADTYPVVGIVLWCIAILMVAHYKVLPDFAARRVRTGDTQVFARILALKQSSRSYAQMMMRFPNLSGTEVTEEVALLGGTGSLPQLKERLGWQQRRGADAVPIWLNTRIAEPRYVLAFQNGRRTQADYLWGLGFLIITALHTVGPALWIVLRGPGTFDGFLGILINVAEWLYAPLLSIVLIWIFSSRSSGISGPTGGPKTDFILTGLRATTDGYTWKQTHYSSDSIAYKFTVRYHDQGGKPHEVSFTETGRDLPTFGEKDTARENEYLQQMPQQRPILYLPNAPQHIWFCDDVKGNIILNEYRD